MAKFIESREVFNHHQPILLESMQGLTITGTNGAFREVVRNYGEDPSELMVGVGVEINQRGDILGTRLLMCGTLPEAKLSTADLYPAAETTGE